MNEYFNVMHTTCVLTHAHNTHSHIHASFSPTQIWKKVLVNTYVNGKPYFFLPVNNGGALCEKNIYSR